MDRHKEEVNLAALLDGELRDSAQVEALIRELERDPQLSAEFDAQAQVKELLAGLEEYEAPSFMSTRVLGEIAARRRAQAAPRWRPAAAWLSGAAALLLGFGTTLGLLAPRAIQTAAPLLAEEGRAGRPAAAALPVADGGTVPAHPGLFMEVEYAPAAWEELPMPEGNTDERIEDFLRFASESHLYRRLMRSGGCDTTGMANAVLVMNSSSPQHVHFASQD